ncbi:MAG TPA: hypothetical protein VHK69_10740, partial [Chitinophagaceae bacterium]|nr:hypothetical protein [Chitinophagaceae bacterium]
AALQQLDIWAVHGYQDGVVPTATSELARLWTTTGNEHRIPSGKPYWMTETSGYGESWKGSGPGKSGALQLAMDMHAALYYGKVSAWVWWQGSQLDGIGDYNLMKGSVSRGKKYYVSKHYYRFIRPGARMVQLQSDEGAGVLATAYEHAAMGTFTMVLINSSDKSVKVQLQGENLPEQFDYYITDAGVQDCKLTGTVARNAVTLPPASVVTLISGPFKE